MAERSVPGLHLVTRYEECADVLRDERFSAELGQAARARSDEIPRSMLTSDGEAHQRLRAPAARALSARRMEERRHLLRAEVEGVLDELEDFDAFDVVADLAQPLAGRVLAGLLAVDPVDRPRFDDLAARASVNLDPLASDEALADARQAAHELGGLLNACADPAAERSGLAIVDEIAQASTAAGLSRVELLATLELLVIGGLEPTRDLIANALAALLAHEPAYAELREGRAALATAVDELVRFDSPIQMAARVAREEASVGGRTIAAGETVVVLLGRGNHDAAFTGSELEELDLGRSPNRHLSFGAGPHHCLGAPLVRLLLEETLEAVLARFSRIAALVDEPPRRVGLVPHGFAAVPVHVQRRVVSAEIG